MSHTLPIHLESYDPLKDLDRWFGNRTGGPDGDRRHWTIAQIMSLDKWFYECHLTWNMKGQCVSIRKFARTVQEAVWLAIDEFNKTQGKL